MSDIPKTARGAFFSKKGGPVEIQDYKVKQADELESGEALVKVEYTGVSSGQSAVTTLNAHMPLPFAGMPHRFVPPQDGASMFP